MITDENLRLSNITGDKAINDHKVDIVIYIYSNNPKSSKSASLCTTVNI